MYFEISPNRISSSRSIVQSQKLANLEGETLNPIVSIVEHRTATGEVIQLDSHIFHTTLGANMAVSGPDIAFMFTHGLSTAFI
jgi:hypothetical protein